MKRLQLTAILILATAVALLQAQEPSRKTDSKIGVVNIGTVFTKYQRAIKFKDEMEQVLRPYKEKAEEIKAQVARLMADLNAPNLPADEKEKLNQELVKAKRVLEDLDRDARLKIGKRQEDHLVALYRDVDAAVHECAEERGLYLVFGFGEPPDKDLFSIGNVNRKLTAMDMGAVVPLYIRSGVDISEHIVQLLNSPPPNRKVPNPNIKRP